MLTIIVLYGYGDPVIHQNLILVGGKSRVINHGQSEVLQLLSCHSIIQQSQVDRDGSVGGGKYS